MAFFVPFNDDRAGPPAAEGSSSLPAFAPPTASATSATQRTIAAYLEEDHQSSSSGHNNTSFCPDGDDDAARLAWLKHQLSASTSADLAALDALPPAITTALAAMAHRVRGQQEHTSELMLEARRSRAEADRLLQLKADMMDRVAAAESDRAAADSLLASLRAEHAAQERRWGEEKAELQLRLTRLAWKDATIKAQLKRKDVEYERLLKQLKAPPSLAVVGGRERKGGVKSIEITATKLLPASVASLSGASAGGDEAGRLALAAADARQAALLGENAELRETLRCLYAEVKELQAHFDALVEEVEAGKARARAELEAAMAAAVAAAEGAAAAAAQRQPKSSSSAAEEEAATLAALKAEAGGGRARFDPAAFQMPGEWLVRVVGEGLQREMAELNARIEALGTLLRETPPAEDEAEAEAEEAGGVPVTGGRDEALTAAAQAAAAAEKERRRLEGEVERLRARMAAAEGVVRQQDRVIRAAIFEGEARASGLGGMPKPGMPSTPSSSSKPSSAAAAAIRRLSCDSVAAEEQEGWARAAAAAALEAEQGALFAAAEKLTAQLDADAWSMGGKRAAAAGAGSGTGSSSSRGSTPVKAPQQDKATDVAAAAAAGSVNNVKRTPLRPTSSNTNAVAKSSSSPSAAALLSPLVRAGLELETIKKADSSGSKQQIPPQPQPVATTPGAAPESPSAAAARAAIKGLVAAVGDGTGDSPAVASLSEALGFLSPIKMADD